MNLRPYQQAAVDAVLSKWKEHRKLLLVLPTGGGKTIVFSKIALARFSAGRTLILAHRDELLTQAQDKLKAATGIVAAREQAENHAIDEAVVVASIQTMQRRLDQWAGKFSTVIIDEAHHALSDSYQEVLAAFGDAKILGVTATPDRGDAKNLGAYFDEVAYEVDLLTLIKDKYLSPIKVRSVPLNIDISAVKSTAGDFNAGDLGSALEPYLAAAADALTTHAKDRKTLVFLPLIQTSKRFVELAKARGWNAEHVDGNSEDRTEILARFAAGTTNLLSNSMLLTEGYDDPSINCLMVLRPTRSRSLYSQMIGRGTRMAFGKSDLLIIDPLWLTGKHTLIKPAHLISGSDDEADVMSKAVENAQAEMDLEGLQVDARRQREESLRKKLEREAAQAKYRSQNLVDPIAYALDLHNVRVADYEDTMAWHGRDMTDGQRKALTAFGFDLTRVRNRGHASALIDLLFSRRTQKLASPKQVVWLKKFGHPSPNTVTFTDASKFLDAAFQRTRNTK